MTIFLVSTWLPQPQSRIYMELAGGLGMDETSRDTSIFKGALAGLIGGLAGAGAKAVAEKLFPPRVEGQTPPPVVLAEKVAGHELPQGEQQLAMQGVHWAFGALAGAAYGALIEFKPSVGAWQGAAFGLGVKRMTHDSTLPQMGLEQPKEEQPPQERISEWVTHAIYGVTTEIVRRQVRKLL